MNVVVFIGKLTTSLKRECRGCAALVPFKAWLTVSSTACDRNNHHKRDREEASIVTITVKWLCARQLKWTGYTLRMDDNNMINYMYIPIKTTTQQKSVER